MRARELAPKCGVAKRSDGTPCRNLALENGRCRLHGGAVPKGKQWHKVQPPVRGAPLEKLHKKEREVAKRRAEQAARRRAMTAEQREAHDAWHAAHRPGPPAERARARAARQVRDLLERPASAARPEATTGLDRLVERLEAEQSTRAQRRGERGTDE